MNNAFGSRILKILLYPLTYPLIHQPKILKRNLAVGQFHAQILQEVPTAVRTNKLATMVSKCELFYKRYTFVVCKSCNPISNSYKTPDHELQGKERFAKKPGCKIKEGLTFARCTSKIRSILSIE